MSRVSVNEPGMTLHILRNPHGYSEDQIHAARLAGADMIEELGKWKGAVGDMLSVCHEVESADPRESINRLIDWHVMVNMDPAVSSAAQALIERGKAEQAATITPPMLIVKSVIDPETLEKLKSMTMRESGAISYAVSDDVYWRYDPAPMGTKVFLMNRGGVAIAPGFWVEGGAVIAWHPLFKRDHQREKELGLI